LENTNKKEAFGFWNIYLQIFVLLFFFFSSENRMTSPLTTNSRRSESATRNKQRDKERENKNKRCVVKEEDVDDDYVTEKLLTKKLKSLSIVSPPSSEQNIENTTTTNQQDDEEQQQRKQRQRSASRKRKQQQKIKAIVKPGGNFLALNPENVMIDSKCTVGRVLRVITNKLKEQSENEKKKATEEGKSVGGSSWFSIFGGSSRPRLVMPADSIFLKVNDVFMPKHDTLITSLMKSPEEEVKIFYFVEETFG